MGSTWGKGTGYEKQTRIWMTSFANRTTANNEELMKLVQDYAISVFTGVAMLRVWKRWIRWFEL